MSIIFKKDDKSYCLMILPGLSLFKFINHTKIKNEI
jgi:hypothetical protein